MVECEWKVNVLGVSMRGAVPGSTATGTSVLLRSQQGRCRGAVPFNGFRIANAFALAKVLPPKS